MNTVELSPWICLTCGLRARTYADGGVYCEKCQKKLGDLDKLDISRGPQKDAPSPEWLPIKLK